MKPSNSSERCEIPGCHRRVGFETSDGEELCATCAKRHPEWSDYQESLGPQLPGLTAGE